MNKRIFKICAAIFCLFAAGFPARSQVATAPGVSAEQVRHITPPLNPLPAEADSSSVKQYSFIAYGDTRGRRDGTALQYEHSLIVSSILKTIADQAKTAFPVKFVVQTGDAVVDGGDPHQWNVSFIELINRLTTEGGVPYFLAPGNHDVTTAEALDAPGRLTGLKNYLDAIGQLIPPDGAERRLKGYPAYAFVYGNTFIIAFDSNIAGDETQFNWVKNQLEGLDRKRYTHIFAVCHHPAFSSGPHGGAKVERPTAMMRTKYMPLFRRHHVDLLLVGHEHFFEHWVERYTDKSGKKFRLDQIVTGGGGAPIYTFQGEPDLSEYLKAGAAENVDVEQLVKPGSAPGDNPYHYLLITVDGANLNIKVIGIDWGRDFQPYRSSEFKVDAPK
ncbi:MAG: metallophosphoesterase family protein [Pyrinomonadaceae bacterium]